MVSCNWHHVVDAARVLITSPVVNVEMKISRNGIHVPIMLRNISMLFNKSTAHIRKSIPIMNEVKIRPVTAGVV